MNVLRLIGADDRDSYRGILLITALAGLGNAALVGLVNEVVERTTQGGPVDLQSVLLYIAVAAFFFLATRASMQETNGLVQRRLSALRFRFVQKVCRAPLRTIERVGQGELYSVFGQEMNYLAQNLPVFVNAAQNVFLLGFLLLYIATLSLPAFFIIGAVTAIGLYVFWRLQSALNTALAQVHPHEAEMLDAMANFTEGFQEIRLNADKNDSLFRRFEQVAGDLESAVVGVGRRWVALLQFSNAFLYALVGVVIFVLPIFLPGYSDTIYKLAAAAIFCLGPVTAIIAATHLYARVEVGLGHVYHLEAQLDREAHWGLEEAAPATFVDWKRIDYEAVSFTYRDEEGAPLFAFGPWNFSLTRGEVVFLTGGNGSGKSTAMKLLCGLYTPDGGGILVDGTEVTAASRQAFRERFSAIFPDFHLFDRLHGLGAVDPAAVTALIDRMELSEKVSYADGRFSTLDLSTGQRKRLAMIAGLLEDRDVYLFDEWAADQDAHFREVFYTELVPDLRRRGKTVVAVTHDDRYWSHCDRRLVFELGAMRPAETGIPDASPHGEG